MDKECLFCRIIAGEIPTEFLFQSEDLVAFRDINPQAPVHILLVPRAHIPTLNDLDRDNAGVVAEMALAAKKLARAQGIWESGYRLVINVGKGGGQEIFHIHTHLLGGWG